jgi:hypothetical protein
MAGLGRAADDELPPVRALTRGPKFHWFGYSDKLEFDPTGRYVLGMAVDFEHRSPKPDDVITIGRKGAKRWFNHLLFSPDGARFVFLHRWAPKEGKGFRTRMVTARSDGTDLFVLDGSGHTSHFIWRDPRHILAWTQPAGKRPGFWLFTDRTADVEQVGKDGMTENGHCSYLPGNAWILNDTYPDRDRLQHPYLYHVATGRRVALGHFRAPKEYAGEWRCDTHPRFSPDGMKVVIDLPHAGGRQLYLIDISKIVG